MQSFQSLYPVLMDRFFYHHPTLALPMGRQDYNDLLMPYDDEAVAAKIEWYHQALKQLKECRPNPADKDENLNYRLLFGMLEQYVYESRLTDERHRNPGLFVALDEIYQLFHYPVESFPQALEGRLKASIRLIAEGQKNLFQSCREVPGHWLKQAILEARSAPVFFAELKNHPKLNTSCNSEQLAAIHHLFDLVGRSYMEFAEWLEAEILPQAKGSFAVGEAHFNHLLRTLHHLPIDARKLLAIGEHLFHEVKKELADCVKRLGWGKSVDEVADRLQQRCPNETELLTAYQDAMQRARAFVKEHDLVSFPTKERLIIENTPVFSRHEVPFAAYLEPSSADSEQIGKYWVTPVNGEIELLREHHFVAIENTSVHEAYPGHHLQFSTANTTPGANSEIRRLTASSLFYEGWALYCEQMMAEEGFLNTPAHQFVLLKDRLWRALRIIIDVKIHLGMLSYDEAVELMQTELAFPKAQAQADLNWYIQAPTVPMGYAMGWMMINALRKLVKEREGERFTLKSFHDRLLSVGSVSLALVIDHAFPEIGTKTVLDSLDIRYHS